MPAGADCPLYKHCSSIIPMTDKYGISMMSITLAMSYMVCPVMSADNHRDIYLPEGQWVNFLTGERLEGGRWYYHVEVPLDQMPVFVRPDAQIKMYPHEVDSTDDMDLSQSTNIRITHDFKGIEL